MAQITDRVPVEVAAARDMAAVTLQRGRAETIPERLREEPTDCGSSSGRESTARKPELSRQSPTPWGLRLRIRCCRRIVHIHDPHA